jgi:hypothetical protein
MWALFKDVLGSILEGILTLFVFLFLIILTPILAIRRWLFQRERR